MPFISIFEGNVGSETFVFATVLVLAWKIYKEMQSLLGKDIFVFPSVLM